MKKTLIALAIVTSSSSAFAATAHFEMMSKNEIEQSIKTEIGSDSSRYKINTADGKPTEIIDTKTGGSLVVVDKGDEVTFNVREQGKAGERFDVSFNANGKVKNITDEKGNDYTDQAVKVIVDDNNVIVNTDGTENKTFNELDAAAKRIVDNKSSGVVVKDGQGNVITKIDAHNVDMYQKEFMEMSDEEKVAALQQVKAMAENGQVTENPTPNPRPEPIDPEDQKVIDEAQDYINDRINAANGEMASLAAAFEQQMNARMERLESKVNENEGKMSNGIAGVAAMSNIPVVSGEFTVGAGVGHFNGSNALAIGVSNGFENGVSVKASMSYATGKFSQKDMVVGAGIGYSF